MKKIIPILLLVSGCASMPKSDMAFHALNAVDAVQTSQIRSYPCITEQTAPTEQVLGDNPDVLPTLLYFGAVSLGYQWAADNYRHKKWFPWFQVLAIGSKAATVAKNQSEYNNRGC